MAPRPVLTCARLTGALLTGALGLAACLPDLDEPAVCPTPAVEPLGDCDGVAVVTPQVGCYDPAQIACLRPDCSCRPDACPTDEGACYPDGDCPPLVRDEIGPVAAFKLAVVVDRLPKTRSGKILRGIMGKIADGEEFKAPATIDDPAILDEVREAVGSLGYPHAS